MRIDDESGAQAGVFARMDDAEVECQSLSRDQGERQVFEVGMGLAPGLVAEFVVGAAGHERRAALFEVPVFFGEFDQLGWTDEGPVLGVENINGPLTRVHLALERSETGLFVVDAGMDFEFRKRIADGQHDGTPYTRETESVDLNS